MILSSDSLIKQCLIRLPDLECAAAVQTKSLVRFSRLKALYNRVFLHSEVSFVKICFHGF